MKNKLFIIYESYPENPREDHDNLGIVAYRHERYILGEEKIYDPIDWLEEKLNLNPKGEYSNKRLNDLEQKFFQKYIALPTYIYDHSGVSISTTPFSCRWDSGKVGYIYQTKEKIREIYNWDVITNKRRDEIKNYLQGEIDVLDEYLRGNVFRFCIKNENGEELDSCGGFYGTDWEKNGLKDNIDPELWPQLENIEILYNE